MRILGLIPARGGSKGIPKKNIKLLGKLPLIDYTINAVKDSELITQIVVSTDDEEIAIAAEIAGFKPPFIRPSVFAQDTSTSLEVVQHAIQHFEGQNIFFDAVCLLQPTTPFREKGFIDAALERFISSNADCLISVLPIPHEYNPHWAFEENKKGFLSIATGEEKIISRRQDLPKSFHRDGSVYITKTNIIKEGSLYGKSISYIENNSKYHVNIDTIEDWEKAEKIVTHYSF
ncbi:acylneuraminate cytidylyltransferase family protein [Flavobacterium capsici]|uniref:Acylneuraminate cytidylyltransferase family protein n=1 Tax=Flavobacterium capsici TaxID=3075618 RepID=A0AA96EZQ5_9FLAO|nr:MULTISPECIES: acylneuraminate cytidylyltransferase family protein [unclassified Flavobacterium]WNM20258.1 acylneuraminate cytidylyltransferase family protein [Flavobacterium sp. PMR2A8]WNM21648.1 acylneuraminate cytidylyltransferase family protein [Flavobacterium sp. PMTSA4]